jgi:hypothetical protein
MSEQSKPSALDRLEKWCRKHYRFTISCGGFVQPGDDVWIELKGGNREVFVACYEPEFQRVDEFDEDGEYDHSSPTIEELINLALDRWESCTQPKVFACVCHRVPVELSDKISTIPGYVRTSYQSKWNNSNRFDIVVNGNQESELKKILTSNFPGTEWYITEKYDTNLHGSKTTNPESQPQPDATSA